MTSMANVADSTADIEAISQAPDMTTEAWATRTYKDSHDEVGSGGVLRVLVVRDFLLWVIFAGTVASGS